MKNIHILPTDKPSRLVLESINNNLFLTTTKSFPSDIMKFQNIYITSDEDIKVGDWTIQVNFEKTNIQLIQCVTEFQVKIANGKDGSFTKKKIILTTDQDLIKDGVQTIDDEFLEWFVKNPSCEKVEIENVPDFIYETNHSCYKIIIPAEKPKQETLEEVAEKTADNFEEPNFKAGVIYGVIEGAKWQSERMYSEEEVFDLLQNFNQNAMEYIKQDDRNIMTSVTLQKWFEQFKKK